MLRSESGKNGSGNLIPNNIDSEKPLPECRIMEPDTNLLDTALKLLSTATVIIGGYVGLINLWVKSRLKSQDDRLDMQRLEINEVREQSADNKVELAVLKADIKAGQQDRKEIKDSILRLHDKVDRIVGNNHGN